MKLKIELEGADEVRAELEVIEQQIDRILAKAKEAERIAKPMLTGGVVQTEEPGEVVGYSVIDGRRVPVRSHTIGKPVQKVYGSAPMGPEKMTIQVTGHGGGGGGLGGRAGGAGSQPVNSITLDAKTAWDNVSINSAPSNPPVTTEWWQHVGFMSRPPKHEVGIDFAAGPDETVEYRTIDTIAKVEAGEKAIRERYAGRSTLLEGDEPHLAEIERVMGRRFK